MSETDKQTVLNKLKTCDPLVSSQLELLVRRACTTDATQLLKQPAPTQTTHAAKFTQRDYKELVRQCQFAASESQKSLELLADSYSWLVLNPTILQKTPKSAIHSMCENLIELLNTIGCFDQSSSLNYVVQKAQMEILKVPFEKHLGTCLHQEIRKPTRGDLFYFSYLDSLLIFVEQVPQFFKYHRIASLLREASGLPSSQIEGISRFKIGNKFGDAEDLSILSSSGTMTTSQVIKPAPNSTLLKVPSELGIKIAAVNADVLGYPLTVFSQPNRSSSVTLSQPLEKMFFQTHGKQCTLIPELVV